MAEMLTRFLLVVCGGSLACLVASAGVLYSAWRMSRRGAPREGGIGWDR